MTTSREREIAQGLRDETGSLIGGLDVLEYNRGHADFVAGTPAPPVTSTSYDLGRNRAVERAEIKTDVLRELDKRQAEIDRELRELLAHRPDLLARHDAKMAAIRSRQA